MWGAPWATALHARSGLQGSTGSNPRMWGQVKVVLQLGSRGPGAWQPACKAGQRWWGALWSNLGTRGQCRAWSWCTGSDPACGLAQHYSCGLWHLNIEHHWYRLIGKWKKSYNLRSQFCKVLSVFSYHLSVTLIEIEKAQQFTGGALYFKGSAPVRLLAKKT